MQEKKIQAPLDIQLILLELDKVLFDTAEKQVLSTAVQTLWTQLIILYLFQFECYSDGCIDLLPEMVELLEQTMLII